MADLFEGLDASRIGAMPDGFSYVPDLIGVEEEARLIEAFADYDLQSFVHMGNPSRRQVRNFGVDFDYERKVAVAAPPIPEIFDPVLDAVAARTGTPRSELVELLVTYYPAGAEITWHRDSRAFELVFGVSLLADAELRLRPASRKGRHRGDVLKFVAARRSLYALSGPARTDWMHHVPPVKTPRYSLTIRTLRPGTIIYPAAQLAQYSQS
ncbi:alpha-ketoglutarate-dependent dioxygenase AlkB [Brevundimonas sp.]|uniref:alpha-ketoglutarate-dependent dioxygenase AlkB n=1 Tax=Brevundimonas sp. TaxID=1871086 RepID=UPI001AC0E0BF|nr:alpha-ketoglutarate-dependent dioxygenase AlkB [Brevundimonas sp.]MBN9465173.1 alpha-ketoglutarate-dependent dioxygenase AlkB [Brevundimonas sp.]